MTTINAFPLELPPAVDVPAAQRCAAQYDAIAMLLILAARNCLPPETRVVSLNILRGAGYTREHIAAVVAHTAIAQSIERARA